MTPNLLAVLCTRAASAAAGLGRVRNGHRLRMVTASLPNCCVRGAAEIWPIMDLAQESVAVVPAPPHPACPCRASGMQPFHPRIPVAAAEPLVQHLELRLDGLTHCHLAGVVPDDPSALPCRTDAMTNDANGHSQVAAAPVHHRVLERATTAGALVSRGSLLRASDRDGEANLAEPPPVAGAPVATPDFAEIMTKILPAFGWNLTGP